MPQKLRLMRGLPCSNSDKGLSWASSSPGDTTLRHALHLSTEGHRLFGSIQAANTFVWLSELFKPGGFIGNLDGPSILKN